MATPSIGRSTEASERIRYWAKGALMAAVAVATVLETQEVPGWVLIVSRCTVGLGAMFGIASRGMGR